MEGRSESGLGKIISGERCEPFLFFGRQTRVALDEPGESGTTETAFPLNRRYRQAGVHKPLNDERGIHRLRSRKSRSTAWPT